MTKAVLDSDRSACSSRPLSLCFHRRQCLRRRAPCEWGDAMSHPPVHPQPSNHTPVETENPVRYLHPLPLQGYNHTPVETENPVRYLRSLQGYNYSMQRQTNLKASLAYRIFCPVDGVHLRPCASKGRDRDGPPASRSCYSSRSLNLDDSIAQFEDHTMMFNLEPSAKRLVSPSLRPC